MCITFLFTDDSPSTGVNINGNKLCFCMKTVITVRAISKDDLELNTTITTDRFLMKL